MYIHIDTLKFELQTRQFKSKFTSCSDAPAGALLLLAEQCFNLLTSLELKVP